MNKPATAFIYSTELEKYAYPPEHPFNTARAKKLRKILNSMGLLSGDNRTEVPPEPAAEDVLTKFHSLRYLNALKLAGQGKFDTDALSMGIGTSDCPVFEGLYDYSVLACGATLTAAKLMLTGAAQSAFNPSGGYHHAGPERASGFCYINDVALACLIFAEAGRKVLYLDVDVHHGDGVAYAFYDRSDVMTISLHQDPRTLFPGTGFEDEIGTGAGKGYCINIPLPIGTYDEAYLNVFERVVLPLIASFSPEIIVFELGADALASDPLAQMYLTNNVYADIIKHLLSFSKPILVTGGGGYNIQNTVRAWALAWSVLCEADKGDEMNLGLGGVMLENTDWQGGLRDRVLTVTDQQKKTVKPVVDAVIESVKSRIFPTHGL
ncbi:MAG: acetoin utilization protein AcuC [Sedimentisphaerales bacterium]|nr:acetoin utilization protein AcuC [Sedimentisphaerales bacterium]